MSSHICKRSILDEFVVTNHETAGQLS